MACSKLISFAELVQGRDSSVRVTDDGMLDVVDLVMVVTGKNCNHSNELLRRIDHALFDKARCFMRDGRRYIPLQDAITLIMVLPGKTAKLVRKQFKDIIVRYLDGDRSMCLDIEANHAMGKVRSYNKFAREIMQGVAVDQRQQEKIMPPTNYIYATKSPAFPGLIKIGKTIDVVNRLTTLNTSCAPAPHVIVALAPTFDKDRDEKTVHAFFSSVRREGEFFELEDSEVLAYFSTHITTQYNTELTQNIIRLQGQSVK
jgi:hypothetical protein